MPKLKKSFIFDLFSKIPTLTTERLTLRRMKTSDWRDMYEYARLQRVTEYLLWDSHKSPEQTQDYLRYLQAQYKAGDFYDWAIVLNDEKKMIGTCGFTSIDFANNCAEVGYVLNPDYWGRGIATEAVMRVIDFGFSELNAHRIEAKYIIGNYASRRVMEKCGMSFEGIRRSSMFIKGAYRDIGVCAIISDEYLRNR